MNLETIYQVKEIKKVRKYVMGYEIRDVLFDGSVFNLTKDVFMRLAYDTKSGLLVGVPNFARIIYSKLKIKPIPLSITSRIVSIGYSFKHRAWYGWMYNYIRGFKIGDIIQENDVMTRFVDPGTKIESKDQARTFAQNYVKMML